MASTSCRLRSTENNSIFLIGKYEPVIFGMKLPSKRQVLQFFFYKVRSEKKTVKESARLAIQEILPFWERARIPTPDQRTCNAKVIKLYEEWRQLQKNSKSPLACHRNMENIYKENLNNLFDIAHVDALNLMAIEEDKQFLLKQREAGRVGSMTCVDRCLSNKETRKALRLNKEQRHKEKYIKKGNEGLTSVCDEFDDSECESDEFEDEGSQAMDFEVSDNVGSCSNKPNRVRGKKKFIDDRMLACMDAGNMSSPFAIHFITATAKALGHNVSELVLNCTSLRNQRKEYRPRQGKDLIENFKIPETFVLHWDGKLLPAISGREKVDRLAIVLTSENVEKLTAIPIIEVGSGAAIAQSIYDYLLKMNMESSLEMICFDTTAANTGSHNGAGILLESKLQRSLLWLPCRHHIAELLLKAVFEQNFGKTSGPEVTIFERFARAWNTFNFNEFSIGIEDKNILRFINAEKRDEMKKIIQEYLDKDHIRHDYRELLQLSIIFLGGSSQNYVFRAPGATPHARFMAKAIYSLKMYMFHAQFEMSSNQLNGFRNVCIFLVCLYVPYWFRIVNAVEAPNIDLQLIKDITSYFDTKTSLKLLDKFRNHLWYLSEEAVGLGFFDPNVGLEVKRKMILALHITEEENETDVELSASSSKKAYSTIEEMQLFASKDLSHFVTANTKKFFLRLQIDTKFLLFDPLNWSECEDFRKGVEILRSVTVVNDPAERKVKLITDFNRSLTHCEEDKQYLLHIVENYRNDFPSYTKTSLA